MSSSRTNSTAVVVFQKTLYDIVKGIRSQRRDPSSFISESIAEIKRELQEIDTSVKAEAIRKLTYIQMMGYNVSWASFSIMEVMSQARFDHKRIGYLAANQSFTEDTDILMLTTNLFKKEFSTMSSRNHYEIGLAINCLANIANRDLARDCMGDVVNLLNHSRPYIRKKAVICLFKLYLKYPQGLRLTFDNLKEKLDDMDGSVVSCAVNVICELARKNPKNYLAMAPKFFKLLTTSSNNWMLIKVVKLMGSLVKEEPRLARKLLEPLATIIQNTSAKSLQYECIHTIALALPYTKREDGSDARNVPAVLTLCAAHLHDLVKDEDQNLKYLGLVGLLQLMESHPRVVVEERELVLQCLSDEDVTIRSRALELLSRMVTKKSLRDLVQHLLKHLRSAEGAYRDEIIAKILQMGSKDTYAMVSDFIWYVSVLQRLACTQSGAAAGSTMARIRHSDHGKRVSEQIMEIALRVKAVRPFAVECMVSMLIDGGKLILGQAKDTVAEVLKAAAWVCGEYAEVLLLITLDQKEDEDDDEDEDDEGYWIDGPDGDEIRSKWRKKPLLVLAVDSLLHPRTTNLPPDVQCAFVHAAMKIFIRSGDSRCEKAHVAQIIALLRVRLPVFLQSVHLEVQERASTLRYLLAELSILRIEASGDCYEDKEVEESGEFQDDLISFPTTPVGDGEAFAADRHIEVLPVDIAGAESVQGQAYPMLQAISAEMFYSVHPKAQRKVPVPEDLNLDEPFNKKAVAELLAPNFKGARKDSDSMNEVTFLGSKPGSENAYSKSKNSSSIPTMEASAFAGDADSSEEESPYAFPEKTSSASTETPGPAANVPDKTFYLQHIDKDDDEATANGDGSDEDRPFGDGSSQAETRRKKVKKKKGKKGKDSSSSSKRRGDKKSEREASGINREDMQPLGADADWSSEDDAGGVFRSVGGAQCDDDEENEGLENIDITRPLQAEEALPVYKHRETPAVTAPPAEGGDNEGETVTRKKKKHSSSSSSKKSKSDKSKKKEKANTPNEGDLIGLGWPSEGTSTAADHRPVLEGAGLEADSSATTATAAPKKKKSSKSSQNSAARMLFSDNSKVEVFYFVEYVPTAQIQVTYRVKNVSTTGCGLSAVTIGIDDESAHAYRAVGEGQTQLVAQNISVGEEQSTSVTYDVAPGVHRTQENEIVMTVQVTADSLLGTETSAPRTVKLSLSSTVFFEPNELTQEAFMSLLAPQNRPNVSVCSAKGKVKCSSSKPKKSFRALARVLNAFEVEHEENRAMSLCSRVYRQNGSGEFTVICTLLKISSSGKHISVDIKCVGRDSSLCQRVADDAKNAIDCVTL